MESFQSSYQSSYQNVASSQPTGSDYAWAAAMANSASPVREPEVWENGLTTEEHLVVLQGQVSFLAGLVQDLIKGYGRQTEEDLKLLEKIKDYSRSRD